jgi:hypothetical protein
MMMLQLGDAFNNVQTTAAVTNHYFSRTNSACCSIRMVCLPITCGHKAGTNCQRFLSQHTAGKDFVACTHLCLLFQCSKSMDSVGGGRRVECTLMPLILQHTSETAMAASQGFHVAPCSFCMSHLDESVGPCSTGNPVDALPNGHKLGPSLRCCQDYSTHHHALQPGHACAHAWPYCAHTVIDQQICGRVQALLLAMLAYTSQHVCMRALNCFPYGHMSQTPEAAKALFFPSPLSTTSSGSGQHHDL